MTTHDASLLDRVLHARAEVLLRRAARAGVARLAAGLAPLVVVRSDRGRELRWVAADLDPEIVAALAGELDPAAAGLVVPEAGGTRGTALTVTAAGARALHLTVQRDWLPWRRRAALGPERVLSGRAEAAAAALGRALLRASAERVRAATAGS
jgi:hypothetical protein